MSKRISQEERVLNYFRDEELPAAVAMLRIATATVKARIPEVTRKKAKKVVSTTTLPTPITVTGSSS